MDLNNLKSKLLSLGKFTYDIVKGWMGAALIVACFALIAVKAPTIHNLFLRDKVGSKVYMIRDNPMSGGGTGFAVKAPSGATYILTNDHVCEVSADGQNVLVSNDTNDQMINRKIIAHDPNSDLCLIEGLPGVEGLSLAWQETMLGDTAYIVGHPNLLPLIVNHGEMAGKEDVQIFMAPIAFQNPYTGKWELIPEEQGGMNPNKCKLAKNSIEDIALPMGPFEIKLKVCALNVKQAYITTTTIHPGNSGSPQVNFLGQVNGVAFASDDTNWARVVSLKDIQRFLKNY